MRIDRIHENGQCEADAAIRLQNPVSSSAATHNLFIPSPQLRLELESPTFSDTGHLHTFSNDNAAIEACVSKSLNHEVSAV